MTRIRSKIICLLVAFATSASGMTFANIEASASCIGARQEFREGRREIAKERREVRKAVRNADSRKEAKKAIREGAREIAKEKREMRREIVRELRPWC